MACGRVGPGERKGAIGHNTLQAERSEGSILGWLTMILRRGNLPRRNNTIL